MISKTKSRANIASIMVGEVSVSSFSFCINLEVTVTVETQNYCVNFANLKVWRFQSLEGLNIVVNN